MKIGFNPTQQSYSKSNQVRQASFGMSDIFISTELSEHFLHNGHFEEYMKLVDKAHKDGLPNNQINAHISKWEDQAGVSHIDLAAYIENKNNGKKFYKSIPENTPGTYMDHLKLLYNLVLKIVRQDTSIAQDMEEQRGILKGYIKD